MLAAARRCPRPLRDRDTISPVSGKPGYKRVRNLRGHGAAACAAASILLLAGCGHRAARAARTPANSTTTSTSPNPMSAPPHEFRTVDGDPWAFTDVAADRLTLLYFGYTSCPDVCPTTMADIADAVTRLGADGEQVDVVMVSTDRSATSPNRCVPRSPASTRTSRESSAPSTTWSKPPKLSAPWEPPKRLTITTSSPTGRESRSSAPAGDAIGFFDPAPPGNR